MVSKNLNGILLSWQKLGEMEVFGGVQSQFSLLAGALNVKEISWLDAANTLGLQINPQYTRYCIIDRAYAFSQYLEYYQDLFGVNFVLADDCTCAFAEPKNLITISGNPYLDVSNKIYPKNTEIYLELGIYYTRMQKEQFEKSAKIVAVSKYMQDYVKRLGFDSTIIENAVDTTVFKSMDKQKLREKYKIPKEFKKVGLCVTKFHPVKGYELQAHMVQEFKDIFWIFVFAHQVNYKPKSKNVRVYQPQPQDRMPEFYNLADFTLIPSITESFNLVALESCACNTPIITSDTGFSWKRKGKTEYGYVINDFNTDSYKEAINKITREKFKPRRFALKYDVRKWKKKWEKIVTSSHS